MFQAVKLPHSQRPLTTSLTGPSYASRWALRVGAKSKSGTTATAVWKPTLACSMSEYQLECPAASKSPSRSALAAVGCLDSPPRSRSFEGLHICLHHGRGAVAGRRSGARVFAHGAAFLGRLMQPLDTTAEP